MTFTPVHPHWLKVDPVSYQTKSKPSADATGDSRGARGFAKLSKQDREYLKSYDPEADREIFGERYPGYYNTVLEGDDI